MELIYDSDLGLNNSTTNSCTFPLNISLSVSASVCRKKIITISSFSLSAIGTHIESKLASL